MFDELKYSLEFSDAEKMIESIFNNHVISLNKLLIDKGLEELHIEFKYDVVGETKNASIRRINEQDRKNWYIVYFSINLLNKIESVYHRLLAEENSIFYGYLSPINSKYNEKKAEKLVAFMKILSVANILLHELGHIYNGHYDYLLENGYLEKSRSKLDLINDYDNNFDNYKLKVYQACEWNADDFATTQMVSYYISDDIINNVNDKIQYKLIPDLDHMLIAVVTATYINFCILGIGKENNIKDVKKSKHLPLRYRSYRNVENIIQVENCINKNRNRSFKFDQALTKDYLHNLEYTYNAFQNALKIYREEGSEVYNIEKKIEKIKNGVAIIIFMN